MVTIMLASAFHMGSRLTTMGLKKLGLVPNLPNLPRQATHALPTKPALNCIVDKVQQRNVSVLSRFVFKIDLSSKEIQYLLRKHRLNILIFNN